MPIYDIYSVQQCQAEVTDVGQEDFPENFGLIFLPENLN